MEIILRPEAAAYVGCYYPQFALGNTEALGHNGANDVRKLGRAVDDKFFEPTVVAREHAASFHRHASMTAHAQAFADRDSGLGSDHFEVAGCYPRFDIDIVRP